MRAGDLRLQPRRLVRRLGAAAGAADRRRAGRPDRLADRADRGPLPRLRAREVRGRPGRAGAAEAGEARARTPPTWSSPPTTAARSTSTRAQGAPVVAVNDGVIKKIGRSERLGRFVVLQDVYGNRYTYAQLGAVSRVYPVPKEGADRPEPLCARPARERRRALPSRRSRRPPAVSSTTRTASRRATAAPCPSRRRRRQHARQAAAVCPSRHAGRARGRRPGAAARRQARSERPVRDLQELLLAPVRARPEQGHAAAAAQGVARDRRHDPRPRRPHRAGPGGAPRLLDPAGGRGARRGSTRSRSSTAGSCSRRRRSTARRAATCSTATTYRACRSARSCCCPSRSSRGACWPTSGSRSTTAAATTSARARSTGACWPRSPTSPSPG